MKEKSEIIQFRIEQKLKEQFFSLAEKRGVTPSELIRILMQMALKNENDTMEETKEILNEHDIALHQILKYLQLSAFLIKENDNWNLYKNSILPNLLDELIYKESRVNNKVDSGLYWKNIDEAFLTNFS
ncbi:MAG: hypothetical protein GXP33_15000, partial [Spirochaetes bacterium]|nr:hypothetical protein [Spirochaetota bacterium]